MARGRGRPKKLPSINRDLLIRQYSELPMPVYLVDMGLNITYLNHYAQEHIPSIRQADGFTNVIAPDSIEEARRRLARGESFRLDLSIMKAMRISLAFSPIISTENPEEPSRPNGALVLGTYTDPGTLPPLEVASTSGANAIYTALRRPISDIFATLAVLSRKLHVLGDHRLDSCITEINRSVYELMRNSDNIVSHLRSLTGSHRPAAVVNYWLRMSELMEACDAVLHPTGIDFGYDLPKEECQVYCSFDEVAEAVVNLLSNAIHFNRPGGKVRITGRNLTNGVMLTVSDEGPGIRPEQLEFIFSPYYSRGDNGECFGALGMGLNVARLNILNNDGVLTVGSNSPSGAAISFTLTTTDAEPSPRPSMECGSVAYLRDRFSTVYVGLCDIVTLPEQ